MNNAFKYFTACENNIEKSCEIEKQHFYEFDYLPMAMLYSNIPELWLVVLYSSTSVKDSQLMKMSEVDDWN